MQDRTTEAGKSAAMQQPEANFVGTVEGGGNDSTLPHSAKGLGERFLEDQKQIWTSPSQLRWSDANWLVPLSGITAGLFVTDAEMSRHISHNPTTVSHYNTLSTATVGALLGGAGAMWLLSYPRHDSHWRETGFLAGEAAINSLIVTEAMKYSFGRQRPYQGNGDGDFFKGGASFPSEHSAAAWSVAGVVAHEYPGPLTKILVYSMASLVDYSRFRAREHFPSDVFVGSIVGNLVAENIYNQHHDFELGGSTWDTLRNHLREASKSSSAYMGSPYVPLDSWVYPAMERLIAWGYINSAMLGMRPWTRIECARLLNEIKEPVRGSGPHGEMAMRLYDQLAREFGGEMELGSGKPNESARIESLYARATEITGHPIEDDYGNYHFGQTILNDYGRPYAQGLNAIDGFSAWAAEGSLVGYVQGEYQHAGAIPALPLSARFAIAQEDHVAVPPPIYTPAVDRFELINAYVAIKFANWQVSYGKQSLWLGPDDFGSMLFTNNIAPANLFLINRVAPFKLPWKFSWLGAFRVQAFLGQLTDQTFVVRDGVMLGQWGQYLSQQPYLQGYKVSFKPLPNVEMGFAGTTVFAGGGTPLTLDTYLHSLFPNIGNRAVSGLNQEDGRSGFDFNARVPKLQKWLTFTFDSFAEDEFSCLTEMQKCAFQAGFYMPQIPGIPKLDFRVDGGTTNPIVFPGCLGCFYTNNSFPQSYTNGGNLIGTWIGRASQGEEAQSTYWLSSRNKLQFSYRHRKIDGLVLAGGGTQNDAGVSATAWISSSMELTGSVQWEKWNIPVLAPKAQTDIASSLGITFWPHNCKLGIQ
jgi:hypothetical protein